MEENIKLYGQHTSWRKQWISGTSKNITNRTTLLFGPLKVEKTLEILANLEPVMVVQ